VCNERQAQTLFLQLLRGVNYLHSKRIVHRDIKPANLLLCSGGSELKITDFNSAKRIGMTDNGLMLTDRGTQLYSAPELRFGRLWNERIDIWACGLCLYYMLRAMTPFQEKGHYEDLMSSGKWPAVRWDGMSDLTRNLMMQCLSVNMHDRPPAMELLLHPVFIELRDPELDAEIEEELMQGFRSGPQGSEEPDRFALLSSCGIVVLGKGRRPPDQSQSSPGGQEGTDGTRESPGVRPKSSLSGNRWRESRQGIQVLKQLAESKCVRIMEAEAAKTDALESEECLSPRTDNGVMRRTAIRSHCSLPLP